MPNNSNLVELFAIECSFCSLAGDTEGEAHNMQSRRAVFKRKSKNTVSVIPEKHS